jgi:hypothetical protein
LKRCSPKNAPPLHPQKLPTNRKKAPIWRSSNS